MSDHVNVNADTGEIVAVAQRFDMSDYLGHLRSPEAIKQQQALMSAYDAAVAALIGPNDVQREGDRTFKKKSAWRKLARHFGISTAVISCTREWTAPTGEQPEFVATVVVRATAPWGQSAEAVGACSTDEETGRRQISIADAIATAETRATNRAISNLIAMGEVSAEEIRPVLAVEEITPDTVVPFGKYKGQPISAVPHGYWRTLLEKAQENGEGETRWVRFAAAALKVRDGDTN